MSLKGMLEKIPDGDLLREMIGFAAQRLMELELGGLAGAALGGGSEGPRRAKLGGVANGGQKSAERLA